LGTGDALAAHPPGGGAGLHDGGPAFPSHTWPPHIAGPSPARTEALIKRIKIKIRGFLIIKKRPPQRSLVIRFLFPHPHMTAKIH
jgi:hypothetical protein